MDARWNPFIQVTCLPCNGRKIHILRDDLLPGGTKQRGAVPFLQEKMQQGYQEFVYASPMAGFAQIALAKSCHAVGARSTVFAEVDPVTQGLSEFSLQAQETATVNPCASFTDAEYTAYYYAMANTSRYLMPLGFNDAVFRQYLTEALAAQWWDLCRVYPYQADRVWVAVGSGTLITVLRRVLPEEVELVAVDIRVLEIDDPRLAAVRALPNTRYYRVDQPFRTPCPEAPPIPSNPFYDAKVWPLLKQHGRQNDFWWNIAR